MKKLKTVEEAMQSIQDGDQLLVGGFGLCGTPFSMIDTIAVQQRAKSLTVVSNNLGEPDRGLGKLLRSGHLKKAIGSYFTTNRDAVAAWQRGELEIELYPQGTLAEAIRAGGAGIAGFYTQTAVGTQLAEGKEEKEFHGERFILIEGVRGNVALVKAFKADTMGNLVYSATARNYNPLMATAADIVIAEVEEIVEVGELDPEHVITPHNYVDIVVYNEKYEKRGGVFIDKETSA